MYDDQSELGRQVRGPTMYFTPRVHFGVLQRTQTLMPRYYMEYSVLVDRRLKNDYTQTIAMKSLLTNKRPEEQEEKMEVLIIMLSGA
jgi:hypothetical protein